MKRLFLSVGSGVFLFGESVLISFLITPYILHTLSKEEYAIFHLLNSLIIWFGILRAGQSGGFRYQLSFSVEKKKNIDRLYSTLVIFYCISFIAIFFTGILVYDFIIQWLDIHYSISHGLWLMYVLLLFNFCLTGISFLFSSILAVYNREYWINSLRMLLLILQAVFTIVLLNLNYKLVALAFPICVMGLLFLIGTIAMVHAIPERPVFSFKLFSKKRLIQSFSISKWFLLGFSAQLLIQHIDILLIGKMISLEAVTAFLMTAKLYFIAVGIFQMIIKTVNPHFLKLYKRNVNQYSQWVALYLKIFVTVLLLAGSVIFAINEYFLELWVGKGFFLGQQINALLCIGFVFTVMNNALRSLILSNVALRSVKYSGMIEGGINFLLSVLLGYLFGIIGIIAGTCISSGLLLLVYLQRKLKDIVEEQDYHWLVKEMKHLAFLVIVSLSFLITLHFLTSMSVVIRLGFAFTIAMLFGFNMRYDIRKILQQIIRL